MFMRHVENVIYAFEACASVFYVGLMFYCGVDRGRCIGTATSRGSQLSACAGVQPNVRVVMIHATPRISQSLMDDQGMGSAVRDEK
jgi:hypothetical protein